MNLVSIGFSSAVNTKRIVAVIAPDSAPLKRLIGEARERGQLVDATYGRRTRALVIMDSGHILLSAISPETITARMTNDVGNE